MILLKMPVPKRKRGCREKQVISSVTTEMISETTEVLHVEGSLTGTGRAEGELLQRAVQQQWGCQRLTNHKGNSSHC